MILKCYKETCNHLHIYDSLDSELLSTIQCFFENNLNISATAEKLFVHRNTVVFRLMKIKELTGFALRIYEEAVSFDATFTLKNHLMQHA